MKPISFIRLALVAGLAACASARVTTDWDRTTRFADYHTYAWMDTPGMQAMQRGTLFDRRLRALVDEQLATKGYRRADAQGRADVLLAYHVGVKDKLDVQQWGYAGRRWDVREYREGTLVIDVIDARTQSLVWRGTAAGEASGQDRSGKKLAGVVKQMIANLPTT